MAPRHGGPKPAQPSPPPEKGPDLDNLSPEELLDGGWWKKLAEDLAGGGPARLAKYDGGRHIKVCFDYCYYRVKNRADDACKCLGNGRELINQSGMLTNYETPVFFKTAREGLRYLSGNKARRNDVILIGGSFGKIEEMREGHAMFVNEQFSVDHMLMAGAYLLQTAPIPLRMVRAMEERAKRQQFQFCHDTVIDRDLPNLRNYQTFAELEQMLTGHSNTMELPMQVWSIKGASPPDGQASSRLLGAWESAPRDMPERWFFDFQNAQGANVIGVWDYAEPRRGGGVGGPMYSDTNYRGLLYEDGGDPIAKVTLTLQGDRLNGTIEWNKIAGDPFSERVIILKLYRLAASRYRFK